MSYYDGLTPTYSFSLRIERNDRILIDTTIEVRSTAEEIAKAKKTIQRLTNEYAPVIKLPELAPQELAPENQALIDPVDLPESEAAPALPPEKKPEGARGLLRLRCPECNNTFGTFLQKYQTEIACKCGHQIDLTVPLAKYRFTCPYCEKDTWGQTNLEDPDITIQCKCGRDIDLQWVPKSREYQN